MKKIRLFTYLILVANVLSGCSNNTSESVKTDEVINSLSSDTSQSSTVFESSLSSDISQSSTMYESSLSSEISESSTMSESSLSSEISESSNVFESSLSSDMSESSNVYESSSYEDDYVYSDDVVCCYRLDYSIVYGKRAIINSVDEFLNYIGEIPNPDFGGIRKKLNKYNARFFEKKSIVIYNYVFSNGPNEAVINNYVIDGDRLIIDIKTLHVKFTTAMDYSYFIIVFDKEELANVKNIVVIQDGETTTNMDIDYNNIDYKTHKESLNVGYVKSKELLTKNVLRTYKYGDDYKEFFNLFDNNVNGGHIYNFTFGDDKKRQLLLFSNYENSEGNLTYIESYKIEDRVFTVYLKTVVYGEDETPTSGYFMIDIESDEVDTFDTIKIYKNGVEVDYNN